MKMQTYNTFYLILVIPYNIYLCLHNHLTVPERLDYDYDPITEAINIFVLLELATDNSSRFPQLIKIFYQLTLSLD